VVLTPGLRRLLASVDSQRESRTIPGVAHGSRSSGHRVGDGARAVGDGQSGGLESAS
jgi:hypothetical protein